MKKRGWHTEFEVDPLIIQRLGPEPAAVVHHYVGNEGDQPANADGTMVRAGGQTGAKSLAKMMKK